MALESILSDNLTHRTVYLDPDLDDLLAAEAHGSGASKATLFQTYLAAGIAAVKRRPDLKKNAAPLGSPVLVLRTPMMDAKLDNALRFEAFRDRTTRNNLIRLYLRIGMDQARETNS